MTCVGFEPTIPTFEQAKTVHALDGSATVTGVAKLRLMKPNLLLLSTGAGIA
jgi:hypothetical protein